MARVAIDRLDAATALLAELDADAHRLPFAKSATTHFASITILAAEMYGDEELPAMLLFATSFCGPTEIHVKELIHVVGRGLRQLFACCEDFVVGCSDAQLEEFILAHRHADTFYTGMQNLSPQDIRRHVELRDEIEDFIDAKQRVGGFTGTAVAVQREIREHVERTPGFEWASRSFAPPPGTWMALHWRSLILLATIGTYLAALLAGTALRLFVVREPWLGAAVCTGWIVLGVAAGAIAFLVIAVRAAEADQTFVAGRQPDKQVRLMAATQNRPVINEFTIVGAVKEGLFRPIFLQLAMWVIARAAEGIPGIIDPINIPTVATARWIAADRGRRLIFISNYTNSAEPYVRDFIDVHDGAMRINLTFGFGRGYPKTRWVICDGALTDPNGFINVVTQGQRRTAFWYGPYQNISIDNIKINRQIREGLFAELDEDQARTWLNLL